VPQLTRCSRDQLRRRMGQHCGAALGRTLSLYFPRRRLAHPCSDGRLRSPCGGRRTEKAFWTRSSRLQAKAEALGSIGYKSRVEVDEGSTGGILIGAACSSDRTLSLPRHFLDGTRAGEGFVK
jgi:hypothetical protein